MSEKTRLETNEKRLAIYERDGGRCRYCGLPVAVNDFEVAHRIARAKWAVVKYSKEVIEHPLNKACTHRGRCNSGMLITFNPEAREKLVAEIRMAIKGE